MISILLQIPVAVDSLGLDLLQTNEPTEKTLSIIDLITSGGLGGQLIMGTLGVLSILTVYLFVERFQTLKNATKPDPHLMNKVKDYLSDYKVAPLVLHHASHVSYLRIQYYALGCKHYPSTCTHTNLLSHALYGLALRNPA